MASVKRSEVFTSNPPAVGTLSAASTRSALSLPDELSTPRSSLGDYTLLLYGEKKVGKTSLAARFPDALFMMFEPGGKGLSIFQRDVPDWETFKEYIKMLQRTDRFSTIVIDTVDIAYESCFEYVCRQNGIKHPQDANDFGKSYKKIDDEFKDVMMDIVHTQRGVLFISHATIGEFQEASGLKYNKIVPTMNRRARDFVTGFVDMIGYYGYYGEDRMLTLKGSDSVEAGHRVEGRFRVAGDPSRGIHSIPMGGSAQEGYSNIETAFRNEQAEPMEPRRSAALSDQKAKPNARR